MAVLSEESYQFFAELFENNNREWFEENRSRYDEHVRLPIKEVAEVTFPRLLPFLPAPPAKPRIMRIHNDLRFAKDKPPYKEHVGFSFGESRQVPADIFGGIGREGWVTGCAIGAQKKEEMHHWRRNLIENAELWNRYLDALRSSEKVKVQIHSSYKKPLYDDTPDTVMELVQAKSIWVIGEARVDFNLTPAEDFFIQLCKLMPLYYFMELKTTDLHEWLSKLGNDLKAPSTEVETLWEKFKN
ncbi:DUF2461 domain-containing protein [bacterium]|nr:DUF2461 domain-containing protein [bacterium]